MKLFLVFEAIILAVGFKFLNAENDSDSARVKSFCSEDGEVIEHHLQGSGLASTLSLSLSSWSTTQRDTCRVHVTAPDTHIVHVRLVDTVQEQQNLQQADSITGVAMGTPPTHSQRGPLGSCPVHVFRSMDAGQDSSAWSVDACFLSVPFDGSLPARDVHLVWTPPRNVDPQTKQLLQNRRIVVTALGKGKICQEENQHTCIQVGWTPLICVAGELLCDGVVHCPPGKLLGDENPQFCRERQILPATNWERLATEFLKKFTGKSRPGALLPAMDKNGDKWSLHDQTSNETETTEAPKSSMDSISSALAHYGPWGYLMLGMLICGTVLTFCGLWECCCKRSKPSQRHNSRRHHQDLEASTTGSTALPSAILVLGPDGPAPAPPPTYEELDQPPSYSALFPTDSEQKELNPGLQMEAQD